MQKTNPSIILCILSRIIFFIQIRWESTRLSWKIFSCFDGLLRNIDLLVNDKFKPKTSCSEFYLKLPILSKSVHKICGYQETILMASVGHIIDWLKSRRLKQKITFSQFFYPKQQKKSVALMGHIVKVGKLPYFSKVVRKYMVIRKQFLVASMGHLKNGYLFNKRTLKYKIIFYKYCLG